MRTKLFAIVLTLFALCAVASAQGYSIRANGRYNLRAAPSLQGRFIETVPPGTVLHVVGEHDRWLKINRNGAEVWMAGWLGYTRVADDGQTGPSQQTPQIDNCCFVDRQCTTDQQWTDGYWAFQNGQCAAPTQTQTQTQVPTQPVTSTSSQIDNCCFTGWQCHSDEDWRNGYHAFQNNQCVASQPQTSSQPVTDIPTGIDNCCRVNRQCHSDDEWTRGWLHFKHFQCNVPPASQGVSIRGSQTFVSQIKAGFRMLRDRAPKWWIYATTGLNTIKMIPDGGVSAVDTETRTYQETLYEVLRDGTGEAGQIYVIYGIVHEACHVHRDRAGYRYYGEEKREEKACLQASLDALREINPASRSTIDWLQWSIDVIDDPEHQWWH